MIDYARILARGRRLVAYPVQIGGIANDFKTDDRQSGFEGLLALAPRRHSTALGGTLEAVCW